MCESKVGNAGLAVVLDEDSNPLTNQPRGILRTAQANTKGLSTHLNACHPEESETYETCNLTVLSKREEHRRGKLKKKRPSQDSSQLKMFFGDDGNMKLDAPKIDPKLQSQWDKGLVDFCAKTHTSFSRVSGEPWSDLISILFSQRRRVQLKSRITISRHVKQRAEDLLVNITKVIRHEVPHLQSVAFTTDCWSSSHKDAYISLTVQYIDK